MRYKWIGVIVAACLSVGMSVLAYGSVKDDLVALEKEAGIDADAQTTTVTKATTPNTTVTQPTVIGGKGTVATTTDHE